MYMSGDIVTEMTREMNLNPAALEALQNQQQGGYSQGPTGGGSGGNPSFGALTPQQQMDMIQAQALAAQAAQSQPVAQPGPSIMQDPNDYDTDTASSSSSDMDLDHLGLTGRRKTWFDSIISRIKGPLVVIILVILILLPQVDSTLRSILPSVVNGSVYYSILAKALIIGISYLGVGVFIED